MDQIIRINKKKIPYRTTIRLGDTSFTFVFRYNSVTDQFTADLSVGEETLVVGEPLIYGSPLFRDVYDERFPPVALVPFDSTGKLERVGWKELGESVFLYIITPEDVFGD